MEQLYDELPPRIQPLFCHLRRIFLEDEIQVTGYANQFFETATDPEDGKRYYRFHGFSIRVNTARVMDSTSDLSDWANHKEQTAFGLKFEDPLQSWMPRFRTEYKGFKSSPRMLDFFLHELANLIDTVNDVTPWDYRKCDALRGAGLPAEDCRPQLLSLWGSISWEQDGLYRADSKAFGGQKPCYYGIQNGCPSERVFEPARATELYKSFYAADSFVTPYASVNDGEDFAESFAIYQLVTQMTGEGRSVEIFLDFPGSPGESVSLVSSERLGRGRLATKMEFLN